MLRRTPIALALLGLLAGCSHPGSSQPPPPAVMLPVPAGAFTMGCDTASSSLCDPDEEPEHAVTLSAFEIEETEVTQARYNECVEAGACPVPQCDWNPGDRPEYPVVCARWADAVAYCEFAGKRLPTEAEWEKAARGDDGRRYPWGNQDATCELANFLGCLGIREPVGSHPLGASPYGALDMAGNAPEWVADWYDETYYATSPATDPPGPTTGQYKVYRGGSFAAVDTFLRTTDRVADTPSDFLTVHTGYFSFRCAQ